jgi:hypothetical protein
MFDLEQAVSEWREEMRACGINDSEILDELDSHLRDDVEQQTRAGSDFKMSFEAALRRIGQRSALQSEFQKISITKSIDRLKRAFRALAGVPDHQLITNMNTSCENPNIEPRWATYTKAATFLVPALSLWVFSCVFLMPKLKQIAGHAGLALPTVLQLPLFATSHYVPIASALVLTLAVLEWRSNKWPRYRRATLSVSVFLINTLVLLVITTMVFSALVAAPAIAHSVK